VAEFIFGEKNNGALVQVPRGAKITIELDENPSTGFKWVPGNVDEVFIVPEGDVFLIGEQAGIGGGGVRKFFFLTKGAGHTTLCFFHKRLSQGDEAAIGSFKIAVRILK
jgi:inhibitor of cysteine peptidase